MGATWVSTRTVFSDHAMQASVLFNALCEPLWLSGGTPADPVQTSW